MPGAVPTVHVVDSLYKRLAGVQTDFRGAVYGLEIGGEMYVVAAAGEEAGQGESKDLLLLNDMLPCGIEPIGVFDTTGSREEVLALVQQLPQPIRDKKSPVMLIKQGDTLIAHICSQNGVLDASLSQITEKDLAEKTITIRVRGKVDVTCGFSDQELSLAFKHLIEKISCPYGSFVMEGGRVVFLHKFIERPPGTGWTHSGRSAHLNSEGEMEEDMEDEDCIVVGLSQEGDPEEAVVENLCQYTAQIEEDDGWSGSSAASKSTSKKSLSRDRLEFQLVWNMTNPACTTRTIGCAPIVHFEKKQARTISLPLSLDALGLVARNTPVKDLMEVLKGAAARQAGDMAACVLAELKRTSTVSQPQVYHFRPAGLAHHLTTVYPRNAPDEAVYQPLRRSWHVSFLLPLDRPLFRKENALEFPEQSAGKSAPKLQNVHIGIVEKHGVGAAEVALVQGNYTYYHYMQDAVDDDGWGCAYRSLQTLVSWLRQQGFTSASVPSHREIQQCLVDIGDKERKFLGSKQWIGSMEVGFVLETRCSIQSRFISVNTGADMPTKAPELLEHFRKTGSPVMIGGGVYAHTILGVAYDEASGSCSWLILDPHYTGSDDLKTIISKGWCGWKGPKFWNQTAFYNMCLPQTPNNTI